MSAENMSQNGKSAVPLDLSKVSDSEKMHSGDKLTTGEEEPKTSTMTQAEKIKMIKQMKSETQDMLDKCLRLELELTVEMTDLVKNLSTRNFDTTIMKAAIDAKKLTDNLIESVKEGLSSKDDVKNAILMQTQKAMIDLTKEVSTQVALDKQNAMIAGSKKTKEEAVKTFQEHLDVTEVSSKYAANDGVNM